MTQAHSDRQLLEGIRREDPGAFEEFVRRYGGRIYAFGTHVCGESEDAKDVAQETLIQAFRALKDVEDPRALKSWIYRVVSNACLMRRRRRKHEPKQELALEQLMPRGREEAEIQIPDTADLPDDEVARKEVYDAVHAGIRELSTDYRMVLLLRDIEQLSTREVATALDISEGTVKMRLHRARLMLRRVLVETLGRNKS